MDSVTLIAIISLLLGLVLLILAWTISRKKQKFFSSAVRAEGKVVALIKRESDESSSGSTTADEAITDNSKVIKGFIYAPRIEYAGSSGNKYVTDAKTFSYPPKYKLGDSLFIYYNPNHPEKGTIDSFTEKWLAAESLR